MDESESKSKVLAHGGVTSVVRIDDSRVILPAGREISSDLVAQELLVKQIMPSDVSGEVLKLLQSEKAGMSRLQVLLTVSLLILVGWFAWYFFPFQIDLCADEYLKYNSLHEKICNGAVRDNVSDHLEQVKGNIVRLKTLRDKLELRLKRIGGDEYLEKQLVACEHSLARLYVSRWMLEGGRGKARFPDDSLEKPGVWSREEALRIAKKYPEQKEFLEIRRFIARTMLNQSNRMNRYYWNGKTYWSNDALENEISEVDGKLPKAAVR